MRSAIKQPVLLASTLIGALLAVIVGYAYLGGFTNPVGNLHGVKVGIVDLDQEATLGENTISVGSTFHDALRERADAANGAPIELVTYDTVEAAMDDLDNNRVTAVAVLPEDLSAKVIQIGLDSATGETAEPVTVDLFVNEGAGALQPSVVQTAATEAQQQLSDTVSTLLVGQLADLDLTLDPANAAVIGQPVRTELVPTPDLGDKAGRGLPPLYYSVVITLVGLFGAIGLHSIVGAMLGEAEQRVLGRKLELPRIELDTWARYRLEATLLVPLAVLGGIMATVTAKWIVGTQISSVGATVLVSILGAIALSQLTLAMVTGFGEVGLLVAVLATTIFGVPTARGVYPAEALPAFFEKLGFLPMRWIVDGARAAFYFDGRGGAGLTGSVVVLCIYIIFAVLLGVLVARVSHRRIIAEG